MSITDISLLSMLRTKMQWHQERQKLLSENVANADTPKYRPRDLVAPQVANDKRIPTVPGSVDLVRTEVGDGAARIALGVAQHGVGSLNDAYRGLFAIGPATEDQQSAGEGVGHQQFVMNGVITDVVHGAAEVGLLTG